MEENKLEEVKPILDFKVYKNWYETPVDCFCVEKMEVYGHAGYHLNGYRG